MTQPNDPDQQEPSYMYEIDAEDRPCEAVIAAVAEARNQSPLEMKPLAEAIAPDAVDRLLGIGDQSPSPPTAAFEYYERQVTATPTAIRVE